jgi:alpha-L-rhamnosidase
MKTITNGLTALFLFCFSSLYSQNIASEILNKKWNAFWIEHKNSKQDQFAVYHFRKDFSLTEKPASFIIHVSADNRYKLYVNGTLVSLGPARSDLDHWNFETVDISPFLKSGDNVLTSTVWNFGALRPLAQVSFRTSFILQGNDASEQIVNTNSSWKCFEDMAYTPITPDLIHVYYAVGATESLDYNVYPTGWESFKNDDTQWTSAKEYSHGIPKGIFDWEINWMLTPRDIPPMEMTSQHFESIREVSGVEIKKDFLNTNKTISIPANSKIKILLDQGHLTNAYSVLQFNKGKNTDITLQYAEALYIDEGNGTNWKDQHSKGNRDEVAGKRFSGKKDKIVTDGKEHRFTTLEWRTFRYVLLEIETKQEAFELKEISSLFTAYPFVLRSQFNSTNEELTKIYNVGWRTARLCAVETYMDTPYYEQLQYFGDTRIQALISLYNSDDDRLVKKAILMGDYSRIAEGITFSRYPSAVKQLIPPFSLWWIAMLQDYYRYRNDKNFIRQFLPGTRQVLSFFSKFQQADGRLKNPPYWEFSDWSEGNGWLNGVGPQGDDGCSAILDFQLLLGLQTAAQLEEEIGMKEYAMEYKSKAELLTQTIRQKYWDENKKLFSDTDSKKYFSQHTNTLAILTNTVTGDSARPIAEKLMHDQSLTQATIYFQFYVNQALAKAGFGDTYLERLEVWNESLKQGLTTWPEMSDINSTRSDCHAWSASPNIEFFRIVLGIDSGSPGFDQIIIEPHLGKLKQASGSIPHPKGEIKVKYQYSNKETLQATIILPNETSGVFRWKKKNYQLKPGENSFTGL